MKKSRLPRKIRASRKKQCAITHQILSNARNLRNNGRPEPAPRPGGRAVLHNQAFPLINGIA
jgi:hypothetical protein